MSFSQLVSITFIVTNFYNKIPHLGWLDNKSSSQRALSNSAFRSSSRITSSSIKTSCWNAQLSFRENFFLTMYVTFDLEKRKKEWMFPSYSVWDRFGFLQCQCLGKQNLIDHYWEMKMKFQIHHIKIKDQMLYIYTANFDWMCIISDKSCFSLQFCCHF